MEKRPQFVLIKLGDHGKVTHVMADDGRPMCEIGKFAEAPKVQIRNISGGDPTCSRCVKAVWR